MTKFQLIRDLIDDSLWVNGQEIQMENQKLQNQCEKLKALFDKASMKNTFSMDLEYDNEGNAIFTMPYNEKFNHSLGGIHGGVIATILDSVGWFTAATKYDYWIGTTDLHVQFLRPVTGVSLKATGKLVKYGKQLAFTKMEVVDEDGNLIAVASGSFSVTSQPLI